MERVAIFKFHVIFFSLMAIIIINLINLKSRRYLITEDSLHHEQVNPLGTASSSDDDQTSIRSHLY